MKPQSPAEGISVTSIWDDARSFRIQCECTDSNHDADMWIEINKEKDLPSIELAFYVNTWTPYFSNWGERLRAVFNILFKGVHRQQHTLLLTKQAAINVANAITSSVQLLEEQGVPK